MTPLGHTLVTAERTLSSILELMLRAFSVALCPDRADGDDELPPSVKARLQRDVWELGAALDELAEITRGGAVAQNLLIVASAARRRIVVLVEGIDQLSDESERLYGTASGRGRYKRQQVKAVLLYAAKRSGYDIPLVPAFLEPVAFSIGADLLIDFTVAHVNQNALWNRTDLPRQPGLAPRLGGPAIFWLRALLERVSLFLTGLSWKLVLSANRLSPTMRAFADQLGTPDRQSLLALKHLRDLLNANPRIVTAVAAVFGVATQQAELLSSLTGPQKQAYVRELIMILLRQNGIAGRSPLWDSIIEGAVNILIDMTVAIFNRRKLFRND